MKNAKMWIRIGNIACALLMVALLVFQFMPFWTMPACEVCSVRCELDVNHECEACSITEEWCVVPTSCICTTKCTSKKTALETCPICTEKWRKCVAESRIAEDSGETADPTEAPESAETDVLENVEVEAEEVELVLTPIAPIPEDRSGVQISIQQYAWLPTFDSCVGVTDYFKTQYEGYHINDVVLMPALVMALTLLVVFFALAKSDKAWGFLAALIAGLVATFSYLTQPIFQAGNNWQLHLVLSIAIVVVALIPTVITVIGLLRKKK